MKFSKPSKEKPVLLILDGHCSHKDLAVITYAKENNVHILSTPPHTTHKLQPLDRVFMKPFKDAYFEACGQWMRTNSGARITEYEIAAMVSQAFTRVARLDIAKSGFQCTGILPLNENIFTDLDFLPSAVTDVPMQSEVELQHHTSAAEANVCQDANTDTRDDPEHQISAAEVSVCNDLDTDILEELPPEPIDVNGKENIEPKPPTSKAIVSVIHQLSPVPSAAAKRAVSRRRKAERSEILTSSPYKTTLIETKATKVKPPVLKMQNLKGKKTNDRSKIKRTKKSTATPKIKMSQTLVTENTTCLICQEDNDEDWICCQVCNQWAHEACAGVEGSISYICDFCI